MQNLQILTRDFFLRDSVIVAQDLLGKILVRQIGEQLLSGRIVETEAYTGFDDPASHSYTGKTKRNEALFGEAGHVYVHSMHRQNLLDIVTEGTGQPTSVLIRAIEPIYGIEEMSKFRCVDKIVNLTNGPGKLCQAFNITNDLNGIDITKFDSPLFVASDTINKKFAISSSQRIGISKAIEKQYRFFILGNNFVSK